MTRRSRTTNDARRPGEALRRLRWLLVPVLALGLLAVPASDVAQGSSDNLLTAEQEAVVSIEGWTAVRAATLRHSAVAGYADTTSLQATLTGGDASEAVLGGPTVAVEPGAEYAAAVRVRPSTRAAGVRCTLTFSADGGTFVASATGDLVQQAAGEWTEATCLGTAPGGAASAAVGVTIAGVEAGDVHHVDDVRIVERAPAPSPVPPADPDPPAAADNLLNADQHSFEQSVGGWTPQGNSTLARKVGTGFVGDASLMVLADATGPWPDSTRTVRAGTSHKLAQAVAASPGTEYRGSLRVNPHQGAAPARCELRFYDSKGRALHTAEGAVVTAAAGGWTQARCGGVAPAGTVYASVRVVVAEADYGTVFYVDDVWFVEASGDSDGGGSGDSPLRAPAPAPTATPTPGPTQAPGPEPTQAPEPEPTQAPELEPAPLPDPGGADPGTGDQPGGPDHGRHVDAKNTGPTAYVAADLGRSLAYGDLRPSGTVVTSHHGQVIERLDVTGSIRIEHDDVVVRAARVRQQGWYAIAGNGRRATIEFVEVDGRGNADWIGILYGPDWTVRRSEVRGHSSGVRLRAGGTLERSYVHSQVLKPGSHNTAAAFHGGEGLRVLHNNLVGSTSSALSLYPDSPVVDVLVQGNLFSGGSYCTYAGAGPKAGGSKSRDIRYVGNVFAQSPYAKCGHYGPYTNWDGSRPGNVWKDNTWADGRAL